MRKLEPWANEPTFTRSPGSTEPSLQASPHTKGSLFTTVGLVLLSVSGLVMWWRRKSEGALGAPHGTRCMRFSTGLIATMRALGLYFPFLGGSMIAVGLFRTLGPSTVAIDAQVARTRPVPFTERWTIL